MWKAYLITVYLFRAYEVNPYDAYLCFLIAQAFLGRALNRQSDNRNYQIAQVCLSLTDTVPGYHQADPTGPRIPRAVPQTESPRRAVARTGRVQLRAGVPRPR